jgi:hypothetical protein
MTNSSWINAQGIRVPLHTMTDKHLLNAIAYTSKKKKSPKRDEALRVLNLELNTRKG